LSHITALVIIPTTGDSIQVIKAGIMEIPDIFIINKIDILSSSHILRDVNEFLFKEVSSDNKKIFKVSAIKKEGIRDLVDGILEYWEFLKTTGKFEEKEKNMHIYGILKMIEHIIYKKLKSRIQNIAINGIDGGNVYTIYKNIFSEVLSL
jgi:LAO/AO transport system kinase